MPKWIWKKNIAILSFTKAFNHTFKRFIVTHNGSMKINKKILINDRISINNVDKRQQQHYSLISVLNHLCESINHGHFTCNSLINDTWYEMNDN